jgi:hypothetical protein
MTTIILYIIGVSFIFAAGFVCGWKVLAYLEENREMYAQKLADTLASMHEEYERGVEEKEKKKNKK